MSTFTSADLCKSQRYDLVMTQVQLLIILLTPSNFMLVAEVVTDEWWFGFEQEFFFTDPDKGEPLGWEDGEPRPQGDYYCGVGAANVVGREIFGCASPCLS